MSFVANGSAPANSTVPATIEGDGWYPALELAHFRAEHRIEEAVTPARVRGALLGGYLTAAAGLTRWRDEQEAAGVLRLEDVVIRGRSDAQLGGEPLAVILWRRAVYASAAASLADTQHDITATEAGRGRREAMGGRGRDASAADCLRRDAIVAMRDLMGRRRAKAALI